MRTGDLTERVIIQSLSTTLDAGGGLGTPVWSDVATVWANVKPLSGDEEIAAGQMESPFTHRVTIHYRTDVTAQHRLVWGSKVLNIRTPPHETDVGRRRTLQMMAEEGILT